MKIKLKNSNSLKISKLLLFTICFVGIVSFSNKNADVEKLIKKKSVDSIISREIILSTKEILVCPIQDQIFGYSPTFLSDDEIFGNTQFNYIHLVDFYHETQQVKECSQFIKSIGDYKLDEFPVIIKSFEKNSYDSDLLRDFLPKSGFISYSFFEFGNCGLELGSGGVSDFVEGIAIFNFEEKERLKKEYGYQWVDNESELRPQLDFFHHLMKSKLARTLLYDYLFDIFKSEQKNLPNLFKLSLIQQFEEAERFLQNVKDLRIDEFEDTKAFWGKYGEGNLDGFLFRRMVTDKIPNEELMEQIARFRKEIKAEEIKNLYKLTINGELVLKDESSCGISVKSKLSKKEIVISNLKGISGLQNLRIRKLSEKGKNYYQFEIETINERKLIGLYDNELNLIRGIDD